MKAWPRSLFWRLLGIAILSTLAALLFAGFTISRVLDRFVMHGLDDRLDAQVTVLARAVRPDGTLDQAQAIDLPQFEDPDSDWQWQVRGPAGQRWSSNPHAAITTLPPPPDRPPHDGMREPRGERPRPGEGNGPSGEPLHYRQLDIATPAGPVVIIASGPRRVVQAPLREAMVPLLASLGLLGAGLAFATIMQLRFGLRPLRTLRTALAEVSAGQRRHIPTDQPDELMPLVIELNGLIDQNEAGLMHARRHVSNLAHGLKTPLAALSVKLAESGRDPDGSLGEMVAQIDQRVRHHLGRARAAAPGGSRRVRTPVAPAVADLIAVMARVHAERMITAAVDIKADVIVAVDPQDLDEMLGNLIDNAWRHAHSAIRISAEMVGASTAAIIELAIDDDGPGLSEASISEAFVPGRRLDERGDGHGFGLSIAEELAELNGGSLALGRSPVMAGLRASLKLPAALS